MYMYGDIGTVCSCFYLLWEYIYLKEQNLYSKDKFKIFLAKKNVPHVNTVPNKKIPHYISNQKFDGLIPSNFFSV